jgi:alkylation response protein AidB-like acyl-CoA dehydrogenase
MTEVPGLADVEEFRLALRDRLARDDGLNALRDRVPERHADVVAWGQELTRLLWNEGWKRWGWRPEDGGYGGGPLHRAAYYDEIVRADLPMPDSDYVLEVLADATRKFAPALADRHLGDYVSGRTLWCQGFSEPGAGSDLAALRTRGVLEGDHYLVNGSKIWSSNGPSATHVWTLVRTGTPESRHRGISALLIDAKAPGVTVRPLTFANGEEEMAEIFFDDVHVPTDRLVGAENQGWAVAMYLLQYERSMYGWMRAACLLRVLRTALRGRPVTDAGDVDVLGTALDTLLSVRARSRETVARLAGGAAVGPEASVDKVLLARAEHTVLDAVRTLRFPAFELGDDASLGRAEWWYSRAATIYGGSAEVQRTILADRVLGLPLEDTRKARS